MAEQVTRDEAAAKRWEASLAKDKQLADYMEARKRDTGTKEGKR